MSKKASQAVVPLQTIEDRIFIVRGVKVILDKDLAELYGVTTKRLNEQVRRNRAKFPEDFLFQLTQEEVASIQPPSESGHNLRSQIATTKKGRGGRRYLPFAFTEYGALQAANVLNSRKAASVSLYVIRAFVRMREIFVANQILEERLTQIEQVLIGHDKALADLYKKIRQLLLPPKLTRAVGFRVG